MRYLMASTMLAAAFALVPASGAMAEASLARGDYLVNTIMGCGNCHTPQGPSGPIAEKALSGSVVEDSDAMHAVAANITPAGRVAGWSDAELMKAIREGIRPDGSVIGPPMPFEVYKGISDSDLASVVMYLRSVAPVANDPGTSKYNIPLPPAYGPPVTQVADVPEGVTVEYGAYLAGPLGHCVVCHTPLGPQGAELETQLGAGGNEFHGPWGTSVTANLTPKGLGRYSDAEIAGMIKGMRPDGTPMLPPMPYALYANLKADDVSAIILYLRSLPEK